MNQQEKYDAFMKLVEKEKLNRDVLKHEVANLRKKLEETINLKSDKNNVSHPT